MNDPVRVLGLDWLDDVIADGLLGVFADQPAASHHAIDVRIEADDYTPDAPGARVTDEQFAAVRRMMLAAPELLYVAKFALSVMHENHAGVEMSERMAMAKLKAVIARIEGLAA